MSSVRVPLAWIVKRTSEKKIRVAAAHSIGRVMGKRHLADDPLLKTAEGRAILRKRLE